MSAETFLQGYLQAAIWTSTDENDAPLDQNYSIADLAPQALLRANKDCKLFMMAAQQMLLEAQSVGVTTEYNDAQAGHDFWLTRTGQGAGFWDRDLGDVGDRLTNMSKFFGNTDLYVGDDGKLYFD